ncbi:LOW QUALITY PROTEIN: reverse transcriptase [Phytophthora megakarya]|uniref:Reverse transcriptase n=1 Tax=Phytophthora megakarya TaxID=4795 RepID=A0A225UQP7_9STRA|nr:LOW QUALITY PROTEIN: reverse transcriptase [Phytophthora megakarya]
MTSEAEVLGQLFAGSPTESDDTLSGKTKQERFNEQSCKILREHMDVLSDGTPAEEVSRRDSGYCRGIKQGARRIACVRLRTELLLHDTRSQPGCGREEETRTEMNRCPLDAAKLGLAAAPILTVVVQDRPFPVHIRFRDRMRVDDPVHDKETLVMKNTPQKCRVR